MPVNINRPERWKEDIAKSVDMYNRWFLEFAPAAFRETRVRVAGSVEDMLHRTDNLRVLTVEELRQHPGILLALRMSTAPPIARDRLIGLAGVPDGLVDTMEKHGITPARMKRDRLDEGLRRIVDRIVQLLDLDIFPWLAEDRRPSDEEVYRAATIVADRMCGAQSDPIIRNAQEERQLAAIRAWLEARGYEDVTGQATLETIGPGQFAFRMKVIGLQEDHRPVNTPVDAVIMPKAAAEGELPLMFEAKSAGDFANVNKRRKEEASKLVNLRRKYASRLSFNLFLCGYFNSGYLGYTAADGIDWVWEHRIDDLAGFGL